MSIFLEKARDVFEDNWDILDRVVDCRPDSCRNFLDEDSFDGICLKIINSFPVKVACNQTFVFGVLNISQPEFEDEEDDEEYYVESVILLTGKGFMKTSHDGHLAFLEWDKIDIDDFLREVDFYSVMESKTEENGMIWNEFVKLIVEVIMAAHD